MSKKQHLARPSPTQCNSTTPRIQLQDTAEAVRSHFQTSNAPEPPVPGGARAATAAGGGRRGRHSGAHCPPWPRRDPSGWKHARGEAARRRGGGNPLSLPPCLGNSPRPSPPPLPTLPSVRKEGVSGRWGPAQTGRLGVKDEQPEGDVRRPAPQGTWHGAGGELRAGRRDRRALAGPRHGRAAGQRRSGLSDPGAAPHKRCAGPPWCLVSTGGGRRAVGREPLRLGAAGVNTPERTGPGRRGGEERRGRPRGLPSPLSALHRGKGGA